jgi:hypothetical protein
MQNLDDGWYFFGLGDDTIAGYTRKRAAQRLVREWDEGWSIHQFIPVPEKGPIGGHTLVLAQLPDGTLANYPGTQQLLVVTKDNVGLLQKKVPAGIPVRYCTFDPKVLPQARSSETVPE